MIYDCLFESVWFTFREQVAPAKQTFGSLQVVIRVMNDKLQEAEEDKKKLQSRCQNYHFYDDRWLSFRNDLWLSFWEPSRFYWTKSDRNGSETQSESRD